MARKGFYEELMKKEELFALTKQMIKHANAVMMSELPEDKARKDAMTHKLLPKIIDKAIPTQFTGEGGEPIKIFIDQSIAAKYEVDSGPSSDSTGLPPL